MILKIHRYLISAFLCWLTLGIALSVVVGYLFDIPAIRSWSGGSFVEMALPTTICFVFISVAMLLREDRGK